ncbi:MAG: hypothetical protein QOK43_65 [Acidimicrobiaceae bacterium]|nr:hypothetical protein [Acidimicrobiaceae bacterium]
MKAAAAALAAALAVVLAAFSPAGPVLAQAPPVPTGTLRLASQTSWVGPGQDLDIRVTATTSAAPSDVELAVSVYRQVGSRSEFLNTLKDRLRGAPLTATATPLGEFIPDAGGALTIRVPIQDPAQAPDKARTRLRDEGVYPVRVELRETGGGRTIDRFVTHLVFAGPPKEGGVPLGFAWVVPFSASPALQSDGTRRVGPVPSSRLAVLAQALDAHPDVPVTLQPTPETVEALAASTKEADRNTVAVLARAAASRQIVGGPYVPVQAGAFAAAGGEAEFAAQLDRGGDVLARVLNVRPDPRTWVADERLDEAALDRLRSRQVDRIVLPEAALVPAGLPVTLANPFELQSRSLRRPTAAASDSDLESHFNPPADGPDDPVLRAHALLADMAVVYFDRPGKPRAVVTQSPRNWAPDRGFLDAVLAGLSGSPIVQGMTLDQVFSTVPVATTSRTAPLTRKLADNPAPAILPLASIHDTRSRLEAFGSMLDADNALDDELEEVLLTAESADLRTSRQRASYVTGVDKRIDAELKHLAVPASRTITLTARKGEIPVSIQWTGDYPVHLRVRVAGDRLTFPEGPALRAMDLSRRNTTERFVVQARSSGDFPLRITLESPEGGLVLARARFTVRSTAASGVGIALSVGAGAILLSWWARNLAKGRRNRRLVPA